MRCHFLHSATNHNLRPTSDVLRDGRIYDECTISTRGGYLRSLLSAMILSIPLLTEASPTLMLLASVRCPDLAGPHSSYSAK